MPIAITFSIAGVSYAALNTTAVTRTAQSTADKATCRAVDEAIVGYVAMNDATPATVGALKPFVKGDITAYRIEQGVAAGPGCR